ncbi:hypothetical protein V8C42DRAFT_266880 [Trichoderma barbatum]
MEKLYKGERMERKGTKCRDNTGQKGETRHLQDSNLRVRTQCLKISHKIAGHRLNHSAKVSLVSGWRALVSWHYTEFRTGIAPRCNMTIHRMYCVAMGTEVSRRLEKGKRRETAGSLRRKSTGALFISQWHRQTDVVMLYQGLCTVHSRRESAADEVVHQQQYDSHRPQDDSPSASLSCI